MTEGFDMGRTLDRTLCCRVPIVDRLLCKTFFSVVMCQKFRLSFNRLWELGFEHLPNALIVLLPGAFQQGRIRRILNERMLKGIRCLWWYASLVHNLHLPQPAQLML